MNTSIITISSALIIAISTALCGCTDKNPQEDVSNSVTYPVGADSSEAFCDTISPETAISTVRNALSELFDMDILYYDFMSDAEFYEIHVFTVCKNKNASGRVGTFFIDRKNGDLTIENDGEKVPFEDFDIDLPMGDVSEYVKKAQNHITPETAIEKCRNAASSKHNNEQIEFYLTERTVVDKKEYTRVQAYTVQPIVSEQGTIAYYQQYTIGWFYVDAESGELFVDDLVSFTSNGDIKLEPYIGELYQCLRIVKYA